MNNQYICLYNTALELNCQMSIHLKEIMLLNLQDIKSLLKKD